MSWQDHYRSLVTTPEQALECVLPGSHVYIGGNAATPQILAETLAKRAIDIYEPGGIPVTLAHVLWMGLDPAAEAVKLGALRHRGFFVGSADREAVGNGTSDYVPVHLHQIPRLLREGLFRVDVALLQVSEPDAHGYMSLGVEVLASKAAAAAARHVVVVVNEHMPRVLGDTFLHVSQVSAIVEDSRMLPELPREDPTQVEKQIADHIATLIPDGATLQLGIGGIPDAVIERLKERRHLGIHTEMMSDGVMYAALAGAIDGSRKNYHPGKSVITFAMGSQPLYDFLNNNPSVEALPSDVVNDPAIIARNNNLVAINSALAVDLTGQVCADSVGTRIYSGFGGQLDFIRGAAASHGGVPIIAFPATARGGAVSRISPLLLVGSGVVTTRADVHTVVTEFGIAKLWGASLRERAERLINIAHPHFRDELLAAAKERKLL